MRIAGDDESPEVAGHLAECVECREFANDLAANAVALKAIDADEAAYTAVRARVMVAVRPRRQFAWLYAAAATMAATGLALFWITAPLRAPAPGPPAAVVYRIAPPEWRGAPLVKEAKRSVVRRLKPPTQQLAEIKLLTGDPNVVIIWLLDKKGDAL